MTKLKFILPLILLLSACTTTQQAAFNAEVTKINAVLGSPQTQAIIADVTPIVKTLASGGKVSVAQAIPIGLNSIAVFDPALPVDTTALSAKIVSTVNVFTAGQGGSTGSKIAQAVIAALPSNPTGAQVNAGLTAAGIGASTGANP